MDARDTADELMRIVSELDRPTKVRLLSGADHWQTEGLPERGIAAVMLADGPHGIRRQVGDTDHDGFGRAEPATCFPPAVTLGSSWDVELLEEVGVALGVEAHLHGVDVVLGPGLNLIRHPAGGRSFEYVSEDPLLSGRSAAALIRGIQSTGVGACAKHFVANSQEHFRMRVDAVIDERTLRELYLRGFEIAITEGRPWTVMSAYNRVNGEHVGESARLLGDILRGEWGFDGLVMSDWYATSDRAAGVRAGMDLEMPSSGGMWDGEVLAAVDSGLLPEEALDRACARVIRLAQRVAAAAAERRRCAEEAGDSAEVHARHHALARRAAVAGTVLLRNDRVLPLAADTRVGVIGALAEHPRIQGGGSSRVTPTRTDSLLEALHGRLEADVPFAPGYDVRTGTCTAAQVSEAARVAAACDVVVLVVGLPEIDESEGFDREGLSLPAAMDDLVDTVTAVNPQTVVVVQNGAAVLLPWADRPAAILEAWLGGQAAGAALADVLLGDQEPGGRLACSIPVAAVDLPASAEFASHPTRTVHRETLHVGYRFHDTFDVAPRFPFGHGLGYTTWEWGPVEVSGDGTDLTVQLSLTNTGERHGRQVVQVYVHDRESSVHRPDQELVAFAKVAADAGERVDVRLGLDHRSFAVFDVATGSWAVEPGEFEVRVGASSRDIRARRVVRVDAGEGLGPPVTPVPGPVGPVADDEEMAVLLGHPVPPPAQLQPFHRGTVVDDLGRTVTGRWAVRALAALNRRSMPAGTDEATRRMREVMARQAPLRVLAATAGRRDALVLLDRVIALLNRASRGRR